MASTTKILPKTFPCDTSIPANTALVASNVNAGNAMLPAAAGATGVIGITGGGSNQSATSPANYYADVALEGIVKGRSLTGTAIALGDPVKVADSAGRLTKLSVRAALSVVSGTNKGQVGIAMSAVASGDATDTLFDVLLTPGVIVAE